MQKFNVGDWVYADDWCYGQIVGIYGGTAYVEFETGTGGGCVGFEIGDLSPAPALKKPVDPEIRDNLLVTAGMRAGYMDNHGDIDLCISSSEDENRVASYIAGVVDEYLTLKDVNFDEYIEKVLMKRYKGVYGRSFKEVVFNVFRNGI